MNPLSDCAYLWQFSVRLVVWVAPLGPVSPQPITVGVLGHSFSKELWGTAQLRALQFFCWCALKQSLSISTYKVELVRPQLCFEHGKYYCLHTQLSRDWVRDQKMKVQLSCKCGNLPYLWS